MPVSGLLFAPAAPGAREPLVRGLLWQSSLLSQIAPQPPCESGLPAIAREPALETAAAASARREQAAAGFSRDPREVQGLLNLRRFLSIAALSGRVPLWAGASAKTADATGGNQ